MRYCRILYKVRQKNCPISIVTCIHKFNSSPKKLSWLLKLQKFYKWRQIHGMSLKNKTERSKRILRRHLACHNFRNFIFWWEIVCATRNIQRWQWQILYSIIPSVSKNCFPVSKSLFHSGLKYIFKKEKLSLLFTDK